MKILSIGENYPFIHLRNHTAYSIAEGMITVDKMVELCSQTEMPAVAITDTNNIFGGAKFADVLSSNGIQLIFGTQIDIDFELDKHGFLTKELSQVVLLVQNEIGYKNLMKLLSIAHVDKDDSDPVKITLNDLQEYNEGLIFLSGGVKGVLGKCILNNNIEKAEFFASEIKNIFNDRFYIEIQRHNLEVEKKTEAEFLNIAVKYDVPIVATNENYFDSREKFSTHEILLCIKDGKLIENNDRRFETEEHYFKSQDEMKQLFSDLPEAVYNTYIIALRCSFMLKKQAALLPHVEKGANEAELLRNKAIDGLNKRLDILNITDESERQKYFERLEYELATIIKMNFPGYFLIVADFIGWAKNQNIPVGPGRGSGAGSVVAWALKITDINPLQFGLLFERFLNPERVNMPDFDIDFCETRRGEVIRYVKEKYGENSVGQIITFGKLKAKNAIKDVGRVLGVSYTKCDELCKNIPDKLTIVLDGKEKDLKGDKIDISVCMKYVPEFQSLVNQSEDLQMVITEALNIEGLYKSTGIHAAGVVIGDRSLRELVALYKTDKSELPVVQYDMKYIENTGLIKYDFLGLKTLSIIKKTCDLVLKNHNKKIDISLIPMDDKETFDLITSGNTAGVFQVESAGMQKTIKSLKPNIIDDLVALVALFRPGPMENIPVYVARKFGEKVEYLHPKMESILKDTYGIMVYQEQVMEMGKQLAGYSLGAADVLRRAMGKKDPVKMAEHRIIFTKGCLEHSGIDEETSTKIFNAIEQFANYGFNKSHAVCYALICYQTAYLKTHFAPEFIAATMTFDMDNNEKIAFFADNAKSMNIKILPPDVNKSFSYFSVEDGNIRYAMSGVKGIGTAVAEEIVKERNENGEFKNLIDFINRLDAKFINKRMLESFIKAGAFDSLEVNRNKLYSNIPIILSYVSSLKNDKETNQGSLFAIEDTSIQREDLKLTEEIDWKVKEKLNFEKEVMGFYVSSHPMDLYETKLSLLNVKNSEYVNNLKQDEKPILIAGFPETVRSRTSKNGKNYLSVVLSDKVGSLNVLFFERVQKRPVNNWQKKYGNQDEVQSFEAIKEVLSSGKPVLISVDANYNKERDDISLFGNKVEYLTIDANFQNDLYIEIMNVSAISPLKNMIGSLKDGFTSIYFIVMENGKKITVKYNEKKMITMEIISQFKSIKDINLHF